MNIRSLMCPDDLDAHHHNRIKVELVIGYPRKLNTRLKVGRIISTTMLGQIRSTYFLTGIGQCRVTNHKQDLNPTVLMLTNSVRHSYSSNNLTITSRQYDASIHCIRGSYGQLSDYRGRIVRVSLYCLICPLTCLSQANLTFPAIDGLGGHHSIVT